MDVHYFIFNRTAIVPFAQPDLSREEGSGWEDAPCGPQPGFHFLFKTKRKDFVGILHYCDDTIILKHNLLRLGGIALLV